MTDSTPTLERMTRAIIRAAQVPINKIHAEELARAALDASGNDEREFTNELGNRIRLTIEGPTSASVNELTPTETVEVAAFVREYVERHPHLEEAYQRHRLERPSGTAKRALARFKSGTLADELLIYADKLRTWTLAEEEVGNVRPLIQLLKDAAAIARTQEQSRHD